MNSRRANYAVFAAASSLGVVAFISPFLPPFPVLGWFAAVFTTAPFERWWYTLPDGSRSVQLYVVGTTVASAVYPALVALAFWFWCGPLRRAGSPYPRRTVKLGVVAVALSASYYAMGWRYGVRYQGLALMATYLAASAMILVVLAAAWRRYRPTEAWWPSLALHWGLFAWIFVGAFPWLGEMT